MFCWWWSLTDSCPLWWFLCTLQDLASEANVFMLSRGHRFNDIYLCLHTHNLVNWKFRRKRTVESHLFNICFPWYSFCMFFFRNLKFCKYNHNDNNNTILPFKKWPIIVSKRTGSGVMCVSAEMMPISLFTFISFWVYEVISCFYYYYVAL